MNRRYQLFEAVRPFAPMRKFRNEDVGLINQLTDRFCIPLDGPAPVGKPIFFTAPTERVLVEIIEHEAIVLEYYLDSERVGTWGVGVTNASGHMVGRYKNSPQTVRRCLEIYEWLIRTEYLPEVLAASGVAHWPSMSLARPCPSTDIAIHAHPLHRALCAVINSTTSEG